MSNLVSACPTCNNLRTALTTDHHEIVWSCDLCGISREGI